MTLRLSRSALTEIAAYDAKCRRTSVAGRPIRRTERYHYLLPDPDYPGELIVVSVAVRLNKAYTPRIKPIVVSRLHDRRVTAMDVYYRGCAGYIVEWDYADTCGTSTDMDAAVCHQWSPGSPWHYGEGCHFPYVDCINPSALAASRYRFCGWQPSFGHLVDYLMIYRDHPEIEHLAKAGLESYIKPSFIKALAKPRFRAYVRAHFSELRGSWTVPDILYAYRHDLPLAKAATYLTRVRRVSADLRYMVPKGVRLDYPRLLPLLGKWGIDATEYGRYLSHASGAGLDLRNDGTLYPPTKGGRAAFMERLERTEAEHTRRDRLAKRRAAAAERRRIARLVAKRAPELAAFEASFARSKTISAAGYKIVVAKSQEELLAEGKRMHNCVGSGYYGEGILDGETLIIILRDDSGRSYCDIEIDRRAWKVKQCYLKQNRPAPESIHKLAAAIARHLKSTYKKLQKARRAA